MRVLKNQTFTTVAGITLIMFLMISCDSTDQKMHLIENGLLSAVTSSSMASEGMNLQKRMEYYNVPGISIAIIDNGKLVSTKGYGVLESNVDEPIKPETHFQIGSAGKVIAALTALVLVDEGLLDLDVSVENYLKSWSIPRSEIFDVSVVTIRQLLSHTAGFGDDYSERFNPDETMPTLTEHLARNSYELVKEPGGEYYYTGVGFIVLEQIIEDVTGRAYADIATEKVLEPLGMSDTYFQIDLSEDQYEVSSKAHGRNGQVYAEKYPRYPCFAPGTCNWSTAHDMALLYLELIQIFNQESNSILSRAASAEMMKRYSPAYGLGIKLIDTLGNTFMGHSGDFYGFHACIYGYPELGKGIVILTNGDNGVLLYNEIIRAVAKTYDWPGIQQESLSENRSNVSELSKFVGAYFLPGKLDVLNVYLDEGELYCDLLGYAGNHLQEISPSTFYDVKTDGIIRFYADKDGTVSEIDFSRIGVLLPGVRLPGFEHLYETDFDKGTKIILEEKQKYVEKPYFENVFNSIGYVLLEKGKPRNAISVFQLAIKIFPNSSNLFDSLGEAFLAVGEEDLAISNYKQSLLLDASNKNAQKIIQKLIPKDD